MRRLLTYFSLAMLLLSSTRAWLLQQHSPFVSCLSFGHSQQRPLALFSSAFYFENNPGRLFMSTDTTFERPASTEPSVTSSSSSAVVPFKKPPRVVLDDLPVLYVYDHCPFCVRVRLLFGLKNIKHTLHFLANDDVKTPTALVGKKIAPIYQWNSTVMAESMDICRAVDADERWALDAAHNHLMLPPTDRTDLHEWQASVRDLLRGLQRPRYVATGLLPEFQQLDARHAYVRNHAMPPYSNDEWNDMKLAQKLTVYAEAMARDPADDIEELNRKLVELDDIVFSEHHCSPGGLGYDDIDLFARLRSITIIKDVEWPTKLERYMQRMAELGDMPLYNEMAL